MPYTRTDWSNEAPDSTPILYDIKDAAGAAVHSDVQIEIKTTVTPGTPVNAANLNNLEQGVADAVEAAEEAMSLVGAGVPAIFSAKGDLAIASGALAASRLAVGSDMQILQARAGATLGLEWSGPIYAQVRRTGPQSIPNDVDTEIDSFDLELSDALGFHSAGAGEMVVPVGFAGIYSFDIAGYWASHTTAGTIRQVGLRKNATLVKAVTVPNPIGSDACG